MAAPAAPAAAGQASAATASGSFGSLKNVCHGGSASGATDLGLTSRQIKAGVLTDVGFAHDPLLITAANVFTSSRNAVGGIDGRKLVPTSTTPVCSTSSRP